MTKHDEGIKAALAWLHAYANTLQLKGRRGGKYFGFTQAAINAYHEALEADDELVQELLAEASGCDDLRHAVGDATGDSPEALAGINQMQRAFTRAADRITALQARVVELKGKTHRDWKRGAECAGCGCPYGLRGFHDLIVPDDIWKQISPTGDEGGLLCPTCIIDALEQEGLENVPVFFASGPAHVRSTAEAKQYANRMVRQTERAEAAEARATVLEKQCEQYQQDAHEEIDACKKAEARVAELEALLHKAITTGSGWDNNDLERARAALKGEGDGNG